MFEDLPGSKSMTEAALPKPALQPSKEMQFVKDAGSKEGPAAIPISKQRLIASKPRAVLLAAKRTPPAERDDSMEKENPAEAATLGKSASMPTPPHSTPNSKGTSPSKARGQSRTPRSEKGRQLSLTDCFPQKRAQEIPIPETQVRTASPNPFAEPSQKSPNPQPPTPASPSAGSLKSRGSKETHIGLPKTTSLPASGLGIWKDLDRPDVTSAPSQPESDAKELGAGLQEPGSREQEDGVPEPDARELGTGIPEANLREQGHEMPRICMPPGTWDVPSNGGWTEMPGQESLEQGQVSNH